MSREVRQFQISCGTRSGFLSQIVAQTSCFTPSIHTLAVLKICVQRNSFPQKAPRLTRLKRDASKQLYAAGKREKRTTVKLGEHDSWIESRESIVFLFSSQGLAYYVKWKRNTDMITMIHTL